MFLYVQLIIISHIFTYTVSVLWYASTIDDERGRLILNILTP